MTRTILWRRLDLPGHEFARLLRRDDFWELSGTALFSHERSACKLDYVVTCDARWQTLAARVVGFAGERPIDITVTADDERRWQLNGAFVSEVAGCFDVDLGFSPSTNLLPIRRLSLRVGESAEVRAAWLPFPSLTMQLLPQVYRREDETTYRYESGGGSFVRQLTVNDVGLVTRYPGIWEAAAGIASLAV